MKRERVCHHMEWDRSGKITRRLYREAEPEKSAPVESTPTITRGVQIEDRAQEDLFGETKGSAR